MIKKDCPALEITTAIKKVNVGNTSKGPIIVEKEEVIDERCKMKKTSFFDCELCEYRGFFDEKNENKEKI